MAEKRPRVTILIRTYNMARFLPRAIDSALSQDFPRDQYEVLVIDDGSTDDTPQVLDRYGDRIRVIRQENQGPYRSANIGVRAARGEYFILLDADDTFEPQCLSRLVAALEANPQAGFAYCDYYQEDLNTGQRQLISLRDNLFQCVASGILFRREVLFEAGLYAEDLIFPEYDLLIKVLSRRHGCYVSVPLFTYYRHPHSMTADPERVRRGMEQLLTRHGAIPGLKEYL